MKILCILYDDPKGGMPKNYPLSSLPKLEKYPDGMSLPSPKGRDFTPGQLLGCVSGELGLRKFLESNGHKLVVTNSKDGKGCEADKHIVDADVVISQPFFPYYLTKERIEKAKNLKMAITAGIGSDHVDSQAAMDNKIDVVLATLHFSDFYYLFLRYPILIYRYLHLLIHQSCIYLLIKHLFIN